jgi:hypothetical protein
MAALDTFPHTGEGGVPARNPRVHPCTLQRSPPPDPHPGVRGHSGSINSRTSLSEEAVASCNGPRGINAG